MLLGYGCVLQSLLLLQTCGFFLFNSMWKTGLRDIRKVCEQYEEVTTKYCVNIRAGFQSFTFCKSIVRHSALQHRPCLPPSGECASHDQLNILAFVLLAVVRDNRTFLSRCDSKGSCVNRSFAARLFGRHKHYGVFGRSLDCVCISCIPNQIPRCRSTSQISPVA